MQLASITLGERKGQNAELWFLLVLQVRLQSSARILLRVHCTIS